MRRRKFIQNSILTSVSTLVGGASVLASPGLSREIVSEKTFNLNYARMQGCLRTMQEMILLIK